MSIVNTRDKILQTKLVYYGPGLGGKTTSLQVVHSMLDPEGRVKLVSLNTEQERTLFFDFLPIQLGTIGNYRIRIQVFTVPGQVKYNLTRRYVLMGADAVVFVADSDAARLNENEESLGNLRNNLEANGLDPEEIPVVLQLNKRDLPRISTVQEMQSRLVWPGAICFESSAAQRKGVFEPFVEASRLMLQSVVERFDLDPQPRVVGERISRRLMDLAAQTP